MGKRSRSWLAPCRAIVLFVSVLLAPACAPQPPTIAYSEGPVTFNNQVVRLLQQHCQACHRPGEVAPFSLTTYKEAYGRRQKILAVVQKRKMPPWKAVPGHGDFADVRRLSDLEVDLVARWVAAGAPEGEQRDLPPPRKFPIGWVLGRPGAVLAMEEPFTVPAKTKDIYRCFTIPIRLGAGWQFIRASEVLPGNRKIVHHVLTFLDTTGISEELDRREPGPGYTCFGGPGFNSAGGVGGWAPGSVPLEIPSGVAWGIAPGAHLVMQVHYHNPGPTDETDRTSIGIHFANRPMDRALRLIWPRASNFTIPAGASRHVVHAIASVPAGDQFEAIAVGAHMHLLGREIRVTARRPDGTKQPLLYIDDWDFEWQLRYTFKKPVPLPGGTVVEVECVYDNSMANRRNPNTPPRDVTWGFQTTDEMCTAFVNGVVPLTRPIASRAGSVASPPGLDWLTRVDPRF
ncbi:MAG TPA: ascorbate-dependent monooxygenase [Methylomirabilota bacterium]|nr:ascorbate-dependent monooxygenase [Methylomirabilota bacterium]